jgi:hypothetical protein
VSSEGSTPGHPRRRPAESSSCSSSSPTEEDSSCGWGQILPHWEKNSRCVQSLEFSFPEPQCEDFFPARGRGWKANNGQNFYRVQPNQPVFDGPNCSFMGPFFPAENFVFRAWNGPNERGLGQMPPRSAPPVTPASTRPTFYGALADAPNTFASSAAARRVRRMPTTTGAMRLRRRRGSCPTRPRAERRGLGRRVLHGFRATCPHRILFPPQ